MRFIGAMFKIAGGVGLKKGIRNRLNMPSGAPAPQGMAPSRQGSGPLLDSWDEGDTIRDSLGCEKLGFKSVAYRTGDTIAGFIQME